MFALAFAPALAEEFEIDVSLALVAPVLVCVFVFKFVIVSACAVPGAGVVVGVVVCNTERFSVKAGIESIKAVNIKTVAAVIVTFDKIDCVPRGPKAVLEMLLVNKAPASILPGCNKIEPIKTIQEIKNSPYKK